jgi:small subunit ribosomal protein S1
MSLWPARLQTEQVTLVRVGLSLASSLILCVRTGLQRTNTSHPLSEHHYMTSSLEAPPQVAVDDFDSAEAFLQAIDDTIKYFNDGDIVTGTVVKVDRDEVLLDIGYKTEGVIPSKELSIKHDVDPFEVVSVGDEVEALVQQKEDKEGRLILSKKRAQYERAWGTIEKIKEEDGVVTGQVIEVVKGGLIIDIGLRGFLPASLVEMRRVRDLQPYVGQELEAKIIELDKNRNNVVLSRRAWLEQTQSEVRQNFLTQLQKGQIRKGVVSSIVNFGAFVDLGGVDGLVHVSELSWKHIDHPSQVVEVGQEVTVEVLDVDMDRERVSLSLKATQEDPWQAFARTHQIGQIVPGKVTKLVPFGAFVRVDEGIEGLVHVSELAERHVEIPEQVVQVGDDVMVKIIDIDLERRRISLSLKQANEGVDAHADDFDPTLYGMSASYDTEGNYLYPDGFDPETGEWLEGYDEQRHAWEQQYAEAHARWEAHKKQVEEAEESNTAATGAGAGATSYSSSTSGTEAPTPANAVPEGSLASDEALQALRDKLTGGN